VGDALKRHALDCFKDYEDYAAEVKEGNSRFDFRLDTKRGPLFVEVKSVSLVEKGIGMFPDAPTERGRRHVEELTALRKAGHRAAVLFISQRSDTRRITCHDEIDPAFGEALRAARDAGVELYGYNCRVTASSVALNLPVPVRL
jgi:sugar fermentation stimulation protein A